MLRKPEKLTIKDVEQALDLPAEKWHGNCYGIATGIVEAELIDGVAVYGHYLGDIAKDGYWGRRVDLPFVQHGWILLPDDRILDPTRFSFENKDPYIYIGDGDMDYDEGGDMWRASQVKPCPPTRGAKVKDKGWELDDNETVTFHTLTGTPFDEMSAEQAFWVANLPYAALAPHIPVVYPVLGRYDLKGFVPLDNWKRAFRENLVSEAY
jgi:hypothetical protein